MLRHSVLYVFLVAAEVLNASSLAIRSEPNFLEKAGKILNAWSTLYLSHPEFTEKLRSALVENNNFELFLDIINSTYYCTALNPNSQDSSNDCVDDFMRNYDEKEVGDVIRSIEAVKKLLPSDKLRDVSPEYDRISKFYDRTVPRTRNMGLEVMYAFSEREKEFMKSLIEKRGNWYSDLNNISAFVEYAKFWRDSEMFRCVCEKVKKIERNLRTSKVMDGFDDIESESPCVC